MFIQRLINQGNIPLLEQSMRFTTARHKLLAENYVNASTPGYQQKDLSLSKFRKAMGERVEQRRSSPPGTVRFDDLGTKVSHPKSGLLFHDRNNRSMEQLASDLSSNALRHNMYTEMLKKQFDGLQAVLRERVG